jgi:hypothetical protein
MFHLIVPVVPFVSDSVLLRSGCPLSDFVATGFDFVVTVLIDLVLLFDLLLLHLRLFD